MDQKRSVTFNLVGAALLMAFTETPELEAPSRYETRTAWGKACAEESVIPFEAKSIEVQTENGGHEVISIISFERKETVHNPSKGAGCRRYAVVMPSFQVEQFGEDFFASLLGDENIAHQAAMALGQPERFQAYKRDWNI